MLDTPCQAFEPTQPGIPGHTPDVALYSQIHRRERTARHVSRKHAYSYEELIKFGHGTMWGTSAPRLPLPDMLMLDRITHVSKDGGAYGQGEVLAELDIRPDLWFFECHFDSDPVMPGCLGLDALWQLVGFYLSWAGHEGKGRALGVKEVKFTGQVLPTSKLVTYRIDIRRILALKLVLAMADGTVLVDGREIYKAKDLKVGIFKSTDGF